MPLRPGDDEGQRDTMPVYQHVALAAIFPPGRWGWGPPPLGPMGLWLWQNQCSARTRRCLPSHRIPLSRHARWPKRLPPAPTSENRHALNWDCQTSPWARPSTGSRCGEHTQFLKNLAIVQGLSPSTRPTTIRFVWIPGGRGNQVFYPLPKHVGHTP